ncbi:hypothetical protein E1263_14210 [Kribbella antibiotica]|uniref:Uncharacterized protein n=1 Tax=Kribbella antibiotica TaxID=190195 RepID=A0A4V2YPV2_9ACTN|nr:hypothetical protein [Kribbella antibiotica]TDD59637.1 hypothetical protein E1263_14210 [Kribbella antibiotica]
MKPLIAAALALVMAALPVAPAAAAPTAKCGAPVLKVWYDANQTGSWANAWFEPAAGCKGQRMSVTGHIFCVEGTPHKIYAEIKAGKAPFDTPWVVLPKTCRSFTADATAAPTLASDNWAWRYGYPPGKAGPQPSNAAGQKNVVSKKDERFVGKKCVTLSPGGIDKFTVCDAQYDSMQISNRRTHFVTATPKCRLLGLNTRLRASNGADSDEDTQFGVECRQLAAVVSGAKKAKVTVTVRTAFGDHQPIASYGFDPF